MEGRADAISPLLALDRDFVCPTNLYRESAFMTATSGFDRRVQRGVRPGLAANCQTSRGYPHRKFPCDSISRRCRLSSTAHVVAEVALCTNCAKVHRFQQIRVSFGAKSRFPDLLEALVGKENGTSCWRRLSGFSSRGQGARIPSGPPDLTGPPV
jgi:hypothetical protein